MEGSNTFALIDDFPESGQTSDTLIPPQVDLDRLVRIRTRDLEDALRRAKLLLHEADHRVKNNMQMISAMLMIQSMSISDEAIKSTLLAMLERVDAMALVHERLHRSSDISRFDIGEFTREIAENLVAASGRADIGLVCDAPSVTIRPDAAASLALVINETITNALRHAFPNGRPGILHVSVEPSDRACEISVRDDGTGMPSASPRPRNFGGTLIETLIRQLKATIEWLPASPGTHVRIVLPLG